MTVDVDNSIDPRDSPSLVVKICVVLIFAIGPLCWCYFECKALGGVDGQAVGFHPLVLFSIPTAALLFLIGIGLALASKSKLMAFLALLTPALIIGPLFFVQTITDIAWRNSLLRNAAANRVAIEVTDFSDAVFEEVPYKDHQRMVDVSGFRWPFEIVSSAPTGQFRGFEFNSIPHIYVAPLRNGCRGVAWIEDDEKVPVLSDVEYRKLSADHWYRWTMHLE